jgi:hypothetical protein
MNKKKLRVSLGHFLRTGKFGPFIPRRDIALEELTGILGASNPVEVCAVGSIDHVYKVGSPDCFPLIVPYGTVEFHFDSPSSLLCIYYDNPFLKTPSGNAGMAFTDVALLRYGRPLGAFRNLCRSNGLVLGSAIPYASPYGFFVKTVGGVNVGFEVDDPEDENEEATLRWFCLELQT